MPTQVKSFYLVANLLLLCFVNMKAQQIPYLERVVTIKAYNQPLGEVFKSISNQTGVVFSYTQPFDDKKKTILNCQKKPLRLVLIELFRSSDCTYKTKDKYIIIKCAGKPAQSPSVLTGYVYSIVDSATIGQASIYVKQTKHSAVSNDYGFFSLSYSDKLPNITVSVAKEDYKDTSLVIFNQNKQEVLIYLFPRITMEDKKRDTLAPAVLLAVTDSIHPIVNDSVLLKKNFISLFLERSKKVGYNLRNIRDTLFSDFTISFTPYISTNRLLSVNTVNKYALNILGGYSMGTQIAEVAGLFNINKGNVKGAQVAGMFNLVGDSVKGAQLAGILNVIGKHVNGFQGAGLMNLNMGTTRGVQLGGLVNINRKKITGVSVGGIATFSDTVRGVALGGLFNASRYSQKSVEVAGLFNHAQYGEQNLQLAGLSNSTCNGITHSQISGLYNRAKVFKGMQLGLINYADSASGIPIGFLSIVKKGYHKIELATDELLFGTLAFCTGVPKFYNIFFSGINYNNSNLWTYGYGIGSDLVLKNKWSLTLNATAQQIQSTGNASIELNMLDKIVVGVAYQVFPKIQLFLGPAFNFYISGTAGTNNMAELDRLAAFHIYNFHADPSNIRMFIGAKLGIKFF